MKPDNYDIPGYKFFLVKPSNRYRLGENATERFIKIEKEITSNTAYGGDCRLIPFEEVDGLAIRDLQSLINGEIFVACFVNIPSLKKSFYHSTVLYHVLDHYNVTDRNKEETSIDEFVIQSLRAKYDGQSPAKKRVYDCFFTRYGDEGYVKQKH